MKKVVAFIACLLASLQLAIACVQGPILGTCAAETSCCCGDPAETDPCLCGAHSESEIPDVAMGGGHPQIPALHLSQLRFGEITAGVHPAQRWHPALPWHAPPGKLRARLSVWIL